MIILYCAIYDPQKNFKGGDKKKINIFIPIHTYRTQFTVLYYFILYITESGFKFTLVFLWEPTKFIERVTTLYSESCVRVTKNHSINLYNRVRNTIQPFMRISKQKSNRKIIFKLQKLNTNFKLFNYRSRAVVFIVRITSAF